MNARIPDSLMPVLDDVLRQRPLARTPDDFRHLRNRLNGWFTANNATPMQVDIAPEIIEGLEREEWFAQNFARAAEQMGLSATDREERWLLIRDVPQANTQAEVDTARLRVTDWLARYPSEENADRWQHLLDTQQMLLDLMAEPTSPRKTRFAQTSNKEESAKEKVFA